MLMKLVQLNKLFLLSFPDGSTELEATDWGWKEQDNKLIPIMTDMPPAPQSLLELVRCGCKGGCASNRCTCRKHGLECSPMCGECKGTSCLNSPVINEEEENDIEQ